MRCRSCGLWTTDRRRFYLEGPGGQHLIRITAYEDPDEPRFAYVDLHLLEHAGRHTGLRLRIRNALGMLRGRHDGTGFTLDTAKG